MCRLFIFTCAALLVLFGSFGHYMMPKLIQQKIEQRIQLKIGTKNYDRFTRVPIPLTVSFYLFNITNPSQVLAGTERPHFSELGPFVYKQWRRREIVDFLDNNRKIVYKEIKTYYSAYRPPTGNDDSTTDYELPIGSPRPLDPNAHNVTIVNVPLLSALTQLAQLEEGSLKRHLVAKAASRLIENGNEKILIQKPAAEILFDGYKVGLMDAAEELISDTLGFNFESPLPQNKFGFFFQKNNSWNRRENGELTVFTGRNESMDDFMLVDNWNGQRQLNVWPKHLASNRCNQIRGTDGSQFHPGVSRHTQLEIFSPQICTSIYVHFKHDTQAKGIPLYRFTTPPDVFAAPRKRARNACYCTIDKQQQQQQNFKSSDSSQTRPLGSIPNGTIGHAPRSAITDSRCYLDGLIDLSLCQRGAPIAISAPHFHQADPMLAMAAGLSPRPEIHETYLDVEPMTGSVFRAASRAQLNAFVERAALEVVDGQLIGRMTPMVAPLMWFEEKAEISDRLADDFKAQLLRLVTKSRATFTYAILVGLMLALAVVLQYWYVACYLADRERREPDERPAGKLQVGHAAGDRRRRVLAAERRRRFRAAAANLKLAAGDARQANLASRMKSEQVDLIGAEQPAAKDCNQQPAQQTDDDNQQQQPADTSHGHAHTKLGVGVAAVVAAGVLGAADGQAASRRQRADAVAPKEKEELEQDDDDDGQMSERNLISNEWAPGGATTNSTRSHASDFSSRASED